VDLNNIVAGFASKITGTIPYLSGDGYPVTPPVPPCFEIDFPPDGFVFNATFGNGSNDFDVILRAIVAPDVKAGVKQLYTWLSDGTENMVSILNADRTLGGTVDDLFVRSASAPLRIVIDNTLYLTAEWRINLTVSPS